VKVGIVKQLRVSRDINGLIALISKQAVHNFDINWSIWAFQDNGFSLSFWRNFVLEVLVTSLLL
jgi:hypothetical protein